MLMAQVDDKVPLLMKGDMAMMKKAFLVGAATLFLAACGNTVGERARSGGAIGAGAGAGGAAIFGGNPITGALVGGAAGAAAGALTDCEDINLDPDGC